MTLEEIIKQLKSEVFSLKVEIEELKRALADQDLLIQNDNELSEFFFKNFFKRNN